MIEIGIDPVAFGSVTWYGIMIGLAILVGVLWMVREVRKGANLSYDTVLTAAMVGVPSAIVFARLLHVMDQWEYYSQHPGHIIGGEGLAIYGAILGGALAIWIYSRFSHFQFGYFADLIAPALILGQAVGRIGCTINACCYGIATSLPWGVVYTHPDNTAFRAGITYPTHPVVVYEIIYNLIVFGVLLKLRGRFKPDGSLFLIYLSLYSLWRFGSDFLRVGDTFLFGLHQVQVVSLVVLAITITLLIRRTRWVGKEAKLD
jgi:phosphatidylglycerol:prolipoprotein diacylglycerol transferase